MSRFARYAWAVLAWNVVVVLWGAYVRASGSGAGCGSHWPLCNGVVVPRSAELATLIEFTHRVTSGAALLLVAGLFVWAWRAAPRRSPVRVAAGAALVFMLGEALIGAWLVLFELVAHNASLTRAVSLAAHLLNTFLLLGSLALTAWWASRGAPARWRGPAPAAWAFGLGALATLVVGMSGAIAALGDTLFPSGSLAEGFRADLSPTAHLLVRLRVLHPTLAIAAGVWLLVLGVAAARAGEPGSRVLGRTLGALVLVQWLAGGVNLVLLAPVALQLVHLALADLVWIVLVLLAASVLAPARVRVAAEAPEPEAAGFRTGLPSRRRISVPGRFTPGVALALAVGLAAAAGPARLAAQALDLSRYELVDLTHPFNAQTLYWPTSPSRFKLERLAAGKTEGGWFYAANTFCAPEHGGTHLDAPRHFSESGLPADRIPLRRLVAPAVVIDVSSRAAKNPDYRLTVEDVRDFERRYGRIPAGSAVLLRTGWDVRWPDAKAYLGDDTPGDASKLHFPSFGPEAVRLLVEERGVVAIGVDVASIDYGPSRDFMVHRIVAERNVPGFENLAHLDALPPTGAVLVALPMKIEGGSGGPLRAIALVPRPAR